MSKPAAVIFILASLLAAGRNAGGSQIREFPLSSPTSAPKGIALGPDDAVWFTELSADRIGRIDATGAITEFTVPAGSRPAAIVTGSDGALWLTETGPGKIGRITTAGATSEFPIGSSGGVLLDIAAGPDGRVWYSYELLVPGPGPLGKIGRMSTSGVVTEFDVPFPARVASALTAGQDHNIWFAGWGSTSFSGGNPFGVVGSLTTAGDVVQTVTLSAGIPQDIAAGYGSLWFTVQISASFAQPPSGPSSIGKIGRITTGPNATLTEFAVPSEESLPSAITVGTDTNIWFVDVARSGRIGRVTADGEITLVDAPSPPGGITGGPFGSVFFTEPQAGKIAATFPDGTICTPSATSLCLDSGRFRVEATWTKTDGSLGPATVVPLGSTSTAGYLWFFSPETPEVTVKMVEGCGFNSAVWFFAGGLTDVGLTVTVTDLANPLQNVSKTYSNPSGRPFAPIQDTQAFPCEPFAVLPQRR
jgi:virginiamycin B lyase